MDIFTDVVNSLPGVVSSIQEGQHAQYKAEIDALYARIAVLEDELWRTQAIVDRVVAALQRLGEHVDVNVQIDILTHKEVPEHLRGWRMKPLDEE